MAPRNQSCERLPLIDKPDPKAQRITDSFVEYECYSGTKTKHVMKQVRNGVTITKLDSIATGDPGTSKTVETRFRTSKVATDLGE